MILGDSPGQPPKLGASTQEWGRGGGSQHGKGTCTKENGAVTQAADSSLTVPQRALNVKEEGAGLSVFRTAGVSPTSVLRMGPPCEVTEPDKPKSPTPSELSNCCVGWQAVQSPGFLRDTQIRCGWFQK